MLDHAFNWVLTECQTNFGANVPEDIDVDDTEKIVGIMKGVVKQAGTDYYEKWKQINWDSLQAIKLNREQQADAEKSWGYVREQTVDEPNARDGEKYEHDKRIVYSATVKAISNVFALWRDSFVVDLPSSV